MAAGMRVLAYTTESEADALTAAGGLPFTDMAELPGLVGVEAPASAAD
jgi:hypothetical protein